VVLMFATAPEIKNAPHKEMRLEVKFVLDAIQRGVPVGQVSVQA